MSTDFISPTLKGTKKCPIPKFELFFIFYPISMHFLGKCSSL